MTDHLVTERVGDGGQIAKRVVRISRSVLARAIAVGHIALGAHRGGHLVVGVVNGGRLVRQRIRDAGPIPERVIGIGPGLTVGVDHRGNAPWEGGVGSLVVPWIPGWCHRWARWAIVSTMP